jgi:hypothetical protein
MATGFYAPNHSIQPFQSSGGIALRLQRFERLLAAAALGGSAREETVVGLVVVPCNRIMKLFLGFE